MIREGELLAAIEHDRDDDMRRLVYADWLEDHGDDRCEFVREVCALAASKYPTRAQRDRLLLRMRAGDALWLLQIAHRIEVKLLPDRNNLRLETTVRKLTGWTAARAQAFLEPTCRPDHASFDARQGEGVLLMQEQSYTAAVLAVRIFGSVGGSLALTPAFRNLHRILEAR